MKNSRKLSRTEMVIVSDFARILRPYADLGPVKLAHLADVSIRLVADLQFVVESQKLSGFPGKISGSSIDHRPDLAKIARSAKRFGAQAPRKGKSS